MGIRTEIVSSESAAGLEKQLVQSPELMVTTVVFSFDGAKLRVLTVREKRDEEVYRFPSLAYDPSEDLQSAARQVVKSRLPLELAQFYQVGAFEFVRKARGDEGRSVEICFFTIASPHDLEFVATSGFDQYRFLEVHEQLNLLEPHSRVLAEAALLELKQKARFDSAAFSFLGHEFSLSELQRVFEAILNRPMDVRNFRKKIESLEILHESPHRPRGMAYRPPRMFSFEPDRFKHRQTLEGEVRFF
ncbi:MAG: hypothetical protein RIR26_1577 [Pseudomonadota bacterium]|jgi:8-oxo-dGTP diphosphatase